MKIVIFGTGDDETIYSFFDMMNALTEALRSAMAIQATVSELIPALLVDFVPL